jgi:hypothetical protein
LRPTGDRRAPQVVAVDVGDAGSGAHSHALAVGVVVLGGRCPLQLVGMPSVHHSHAVDCGLPPLAVPVIDEAS